MSSTAWIAPEQAAEVVQASLRSMINSARNLKDAAEEAIQPFADSVSNLEDADYEELVYAIMVVLGSERLMKEISDNRRHRHPDTGSLRWEAMRIVKALKEYSHLGGKKGPSCVSEVHASIVRELLDEVNDRTIRPGDRVAWDEDESLMSGTVLAIDDGECAVGHLHRRNGASGSPCRGMRLKSVGELRKHASTFL